MIDLDELEALEKQGNWGDTEYLKFRFSLPELIALARDGQRWRYGEQNGFPQRCRASTTATVSEAWTYRGMMAGSANELIDAAMREGK